MSNDYEILKRIMAKVGLEMNRSTDFDVLSQAISESTNENLGVNTLKRLFGFKIEKAVPRISTRKLPFVDTKLAKKFLSTK